MALSLKQSKAVADLAELLYDFLPGSGSPKWRGHVSFRTVSEKVGVGRFWQPGSKIPMITSLLERTFEHRREVFERLILEVFRAGIVHRQKQGDRIKPEELDKLNGLILELGFKYPDLWDPDLRDSLRADSGSRAQDRVDQAMREEALRATAESKRDRQLVELKEQFFELHGEPNRQAAGLALEKILNRLFTLHGLAPREPFRVVGEQIDGSFELDHETYLVEAKWEKQPLPESGLLVFRGKMEGKSPYTRGVFIAMNGISDAAKHAITRGKQPIFFVVNGYDLTMVLSGAVGLEEFLRRRRRLLAEEGQVVVPYARVVQNL